MERVERERERDKFCVINVKYKEISWRVRKKKKKSNFQKQRVKLVLKKIMYIYTCKYENSQQDQVDIEVLEVVSSSIDVLCGVESIEDQQMTIFDIQKFPE